MQIEYFSNLIKNKSHLLVFQAHFCSNQSARAGWLLHFPQNYPFALTIDTGGSWSAIQHEYFTRFYFTKRFSAIERLLKDYFTPALTDFYFLKKLLIGLIINQLWRPKFRRNKGSAQALNIRVLSCLGWSSAAYWHHNKWSL